MTKKRSLTGTQRTKSEFKNKFVLILEVGAFFTPKGAFFKTFWGQK